MTALYKNGVPGPFHRLNTRQQQQAIRRDRIAAMNGDTKALDLLDRLNNRTALVAAAPIPRGQLQLRKR